MILSGYRPNKKCPIFLIKLCDELRSAEWLVTRLSERSEHSINASAASTPGSASEASYVYFYRGIFMGELGEGFF